MRLHIIVAAFICLIANLAMAQTVGSNADKPIRLSLGQTCKDCPVGWTCETRKQKVFSSGRSACSECDAMGNYTICIPPAPDQRLDGDSDELTPKGVTGRDTIPPQQPCCDQVTNIDKSINFKFESHYNVTINEACCDEVAPKAVRIGLKIYPYAEAWATGEVWRKNPISGRPDMPVGFGIQNDPASVWILRTGLRYRAAWDQKFPAPFDWCECEDYPSAAVWSSLTEVGYKWFLSGNKSLFVQPSVMMDLAINKHSTPLEPEARKSWNVPGHLAANMSLGYQHQFLDRKTATSSWLIVQLFARNQFAGLGFIDHGIAVGGTIRFVWAGKIRGGKTASPREASGRSPQ